MAWIYLLLASIFEIVFAVSMKQSHGFTKPVPTVLTVVGVIGGIGLLTLALKTLPVSVGYPIWVGIGTLGTVVIGMAVLNESVTPIKVASVLLIVLGVIGLKMSTEKPAESDSVDTVAVPEST